MRIPIASGDLIMNCETLDKNDLESQIDSLERVLEHPLRSMSHCERLSKMFLLRELQAELQRVTEDESESSLY
jgi:hypothetical protein